MAGFTTSVPAGGCGDNDGAKRHLKYYFPSMDSPLGPRRKEEIMIIKREKRHGSKKNSQGNSSEFVYYACHSLHSKEQKRKCYFLPGLKSAFFFLLLLHRSADVTVSDSMHQVKTRKIIFAIGDARILRED